ncbi:MAG: radical SAM/SPASM domain-containing protein [Armatimonadota bacterium]
MSTGRNQPFRALLVAAANDTAVECACTRLLQDHPGLDLTIIARAGRAARAGRVVTCATRGPYGFVLTPALLRELRSGFDLAWAVVGDLDSPAYRRVALLLSLARAKEKAAVSPTGEVVSLDYWLRRSGISLGPLSLLSAAWRGALTPYRRRRATRLLHGDRPPFGLRRVNIGVSDRCNHRCVMCSEHSPFCVDGGRRMAAEGVLSERDFGLMDPDTYRHLIRDLSEMGCREIELCGLGEPLLHPRLFDFLREAKAAGLWVRLVTNAALLGEDRARALAGQDAKVLPYGIDEIHISLNAGTPETYAKVHGVAPSVFHRVLAAIRAIAYARQATGRATPTIETSFVVQADNYREPIEWVKAVADAGADIATFSALGAAPPGAPVQLSPEQMEEAKANVAAAVELAKSRGLEVRGTFGALADSGPAFSESLYAHMPCYIGHIFALVTASGRIHPCCACERVVGDLKDGGFAKAWRGEAYRRFRDECFDLPNRLPGLEGLSAGRVADCSCMACPYGPWNVEFHQRLYRA